MQLFDDGEEWLDRRPATRWFQDRRLAAVMQSAILFHDGKRCDVHAFVVMPSHVHLVFTPYSVPAAAASHTARGGGLSPRTAIMHSIKLFAARACNRLLGREGTFWQSESYDRVVRDEAELARFVTYVEHNPVKAGLCQRPEEWEFSSAHGKPDRG
jgi:REP element-mobilizing transposase RayT